MKKIELTAGQIKSLGEMFEEQTLSENSTRVDGIIIFEDGNIQLFYTDDGKPKVKDISIYD